MDLFPFVVLLRLMKSNEKIICGRWKVDAVFFTYSGESRSVCFYLKLGEELKICKLFKILPRNVNWIWNRKSHENKSSTSIPSSHRISSTVIQISFYYETLLSDVTSDLNLCFTKLFFSWWLRKFQKLTSQFNNQWRKLINFQSENVCFWFEIQHSPYVTKALNKRPQF